MLDPEKELFAKEKLAREIEYMKAWDPDVFLFADGVGYVQAWKYQNSFWIECNGVNGEYFSNKFTDCDMVNTCEYYFGALRTGYPLWEVYQCCTR